MCRYLYFFNFKKGVIVLDYFNAERLKELESQLEILRYRNNALQEELDVLGRKYKKAVEIINVLQKEKLDVV